jgi:hypothetical protein
MGVAEVSATIQPRKGGTVCKAHFDLLHQRVEVDRAVLDACAACQRSREARAEYIQQHETIDPTQPYGVHISLRCKNHPDLRWSTKNISYIGARSVFYQEGLSGPECPCLMSDLEVVPDEPCIHPGVFAQPGRDSEHCYRCDRDVPIEEL